MKSLERLLIIENNPKYIETAKEYFSKYFSKIDDFNIIVDYETAKTELKNYDKVLIDVFIPENKSERLGREGNMLIEEIRTMLECERNNHLIKVLKENEKELYNSIKRYLKFVHGIEDENLISQNLHKLPLKNYEMLIHNASTTAIIYKANKLENLCHELETLTKEESLGHSPLGIRIGEKALELGIPFAFVTDTVFHHGHTGVCFIVEDFFKIKYGYNPKILDSRYGRKDEQNFWEAAYREVNKIKKIKIK